MAPAVVIDISTRADDNPDAQLTTVDLQSWEESHGEIPEGAIVFMNSGWDARWPNKTAVFGTDGATDLHFPGFDAQAVEWLIENRDVVGVAVDTPSIDHGPSEVFECHQIMTRHNVYGLENVNNLGELPPSGATVTAMPMKIGGGSGAPARIVATWGGETCGSMGMSPLAFLAMICPIWAFICSKINED